MKKNTIIERIIDEGLVQEGSWIVTGVSGGPDSLCLLHALHRLSDSMDLTIIPVHVNHMLRPEADDEAENVARICDRLGLECALFAADCSEMAEDMKISTEEAGRYIRYEIFDDVAEQIENEGVPKEKINIAVAHNADDQSETVLFRLLRGTGIHGLGGIPAARDSDSGYLIIRPLLTTERSEIEEYIRENKLRPNIDKTNEGTDYTRNRIRNELIPYLEKNFNPNIKDTLRRYAGLAALDDGLLTDLALSECEDCLTVDEEEGRVVLDISELKETHPSVTSRIISLVFKVLRIEMGAGYELVASMLDMLYSDNPSSSIDLPGDFRAVREYDSIIFAGSDEDLSVKAESLMMFPQVMMMKDFHPDPEAVYAAFDFDKFNEEHPGKAGELELRTRREGDYLPMKSGRKKIQDLLVDSKVKKNARDSILMVAIGSEVLWVLPNRYFTGKQEQEKGRFSPKYHITDTTERVLYIEIGDDL